MNDLYIVKEVNNDNNKFFGEIITDGYFSSAVQKEMKRDSSTTDEVVNNVFENATSILNECPNPNEVGEFHRTGIVIGKVQSGKTSCFIALLALAFDNNYNIGVVIGGNTTELLTQNVERIKRAFNVSTDKLVVLHSKNNNELINPENIKRFIKNGTKVLIVTLKSPQTKNKKHMSRVADLFSDNALANQTTIIIDDEGDQATLNSKVYKKAFAETYKVAIDIKNKIKRHCFISITATPQANILIDVNDKLSPDFGKLIYPGKGYCGLSVFHGEEENKYVKEIDDNENSMLDENSGIPESFYDALSAFYVSNAIRISRGDTGIHSMLIHPSFKKPDHKLVQHKVDELIQNWQDIASLGIYEISYKLSLKKYLLKAYEMYKNDSVNVRPFEELENQILKCISQSSYSLVFNSDQSDARSNAELYNTRIYVGGNILDRGITIKGLAITYIFRRAKGVGSVDTIEQRARWFGYKNIPGTSDYIDICRVWATKSIKKDFASINESDEEMWNSIERNMKMGKSFKELPRYFQLQDDASHKLQLTRSSVARTKKLYRSEWKQQEYFVDNECDANFNMKLLDDFKNAHISKGKVIDFKGENLHLFIYDVGLSEFLEQVLDNFRFSSREMNYAEYLTHLDAMIQSKNLDKTIDLVWVRIKANETRKIESDGSIQQLFRGRDIKPNEKGKFNYKGDRATCDFRPNKIQIQIHYVKPSNISDINYYSPAICIYIPNDYVEKIQTVGRE